MGYFYQHLDNIRDETISAEQREISAHFMTKTFSHCTHSAHENA